MSRFNFLVIFFLTILLGSCTNQFDYKPSAWKQVIETDTEDKSKYTVGYIDENRVDCKDAECQAWTKLVFGEPRSVGYSGSKQGQVAGELQVKRVDSSIKFDCKRSLMTIISYQLYNKEDKMIDSKWIQFEPEYVKKNSINYGLMKAICKDNEEK